MTLLLILIALVIGYVIGFYSDAKVTSNRVTNITYVCPEHKENN